MKFLNREDIYKYTGDSSQVFGARQFIFAEGKARGMRAVEVDNGSGLRFTVLPDRSMDIGALSYKGINFSYICKAGYVAPAYYDDAGIGWLKTFTGGFLTTCGLTQAGAPCTDEDEELGIHGDISTSPAEDLCVSTDLGAQVPVIVISGKMRTGRLFGYSIWLHREIRIEYGVNRIYITDKVENRGGEERPYMILYHFNMGYPLLDEHTKFVTNARYLRPRDDEAEKGISWRTGFQKPQSGFKEQVFYYESISEPGKTCFAGLYNRELGIGANIHVKPGQLPNIIQWKNAGHGDYVQGIEPANCWPEGRVKQREYGLAVIKPYETKVQEIYIEIT